jgi:hypothetical protein
MDKRASFLCDVSDSAQAALVEGARDVQPVHGLTHNFYCYPARFSPTFARAAIEAFTGPGDYVLDPYFGGGTSLVEAVVLGRNALGVDISELAEFVATVKTTVLSKSDLQCLGQWAAKLPHDAVDAETDITPHERVEAERIKQGAEERARNRRRSGFACPCAGLWPSAHWRLLFQTFQP